MTTTKGPEARITANVLRYLKSIPECEAIKVHGGLYGSTGEPDILACYHGTMVRFEVKQPGRVGTLTPMQARRLRAWERAGAVVAVITSVDEAKLVIGAMNAAPEGTVLDLLRGIQQRLPV